MKRDVILIITGLGVSILSMYFVLTKGVLAGGVFISGIAIGVLNSAIRTYGNREFLISKKISAWAFVLLYLMRIIVPVLFCVGIMRIEGVLCVIFLMGFGAQFFNVDLKKSWIKYS